MKDDQASSTAYLIARSTAYLSRDPQLGHFVPSEAAEASAWFMRVCSPRADKELEAMNGKWFRWRSGLAERLSVPGIILHYIMRKRYIEEAVRNSMEEGFQQIVVLAGGFDTLALRLHQKFTEVNFIEVDHPATQKLKREALEQRGFPKPNMSFLSVDFTKQTLEERLQSCDAYDPKLNTLFIAEGVLMYLTAEEVGTIFRFIREYGGPRTRFAFTFMEPHRGKVRFKNSSLAVDFWLWLKNEEFDWGIMRDDLPDYLQSSRFEFLDLATPDTFRTQYLKPEGLEDVTLADGEYVCLAEASRDR